MANDKRQRQKAARHARLEAEMAQARRQATVRRARNLAIFGAIAIAVIFILSNRGDDKGDTAATTTTLAPTTTVPPFEYGTGSCAPADGSAKRTTTFKDAPRSCIDPEKTYTATIETSKGEIEVALDPATSPGTVNNFVNLARFHFYDATTIHRVAPTIDVIQGGDPVGRPPGTGGPGYTIPDEGAPPRSYDEGVIAMANTSQPDSGGSQWFIVGGPDGHNLDASSLWTIFGQVTKGMDVVKEILAVPLGGESGEEPKETIAVERVTVSER